ncbi:DUF3108 domain-containing protein [Falsiroseomonas oryziterrae]|uniref:DUF3108 domain-containing protein n=1 Tax=Falsiroseomonas oryziterrae TaxID=2911368 RepID=UPI001F1A1BF0|nr:DUF3108 domain-containing protein [Roseomonas sp. NPKOSM-4]
MRRFLGFLLLFPAAAAAQPMRATYEVHAAGMVVMEVEARFEVTPRSYRVETVVRTRGLAATFVSGEQATRVDGGWAGPSALPARYVSEGVWRGRPRRIALDWDGGAPRVTALVPPNEEEREAVPEAQKRGTTDVLSAIAQLGRQVAAEGHCALTAPVFDGRRRSDFATRDEGRERILPWRGAWHGEALRCAFEGRQVAGFRRDQDRAEAAAPQRGTAWIAPPFAGAPAVPVRIDIPTRWFGTATAVLLRAEPG